MSSHNSPALVLEPHASWLFWRPASHRISRFTWQQDGRWQLELANGCCVAAMLGVQSWRHPWLMSLRWQLESGGQRRVLLWRWQYSPAQWHALRLRLALEGRSGERVSLAT